jgi:hypothetical protein
MHCVSKIHYIFLFLSALLCGSASQAQTVLARAQAEPSVVMLGDASTYSIRFLNTESVPNFNTPRVDGLEFGSTPSTSSYRQIINGRSSIETELSWSFRPTRTGTFIIPGRTVKIRDEEIRIPDVEVRSIPMDEETKSRALLIIEMPEPPFYVGQSLPARVNLLGRRDLNISPRDFPQCESEAFQHTEFSNSPRRGTVQYAGRSYNAIVWDILITPIKSGPTELSFRQDLALQVVTRDSRFPSIFNMSSSRTEPITVMSDTLETEILALPDPANPDTFTGAIGSFEVNRTLADTELTVGEPVTLTLSIKGEGNFERIGPPELPEWEGWRLYPPKVDFTQDGEDGFSGTKSFEFILIPQSIDLTEVPGFTYSTFDPETGVYRSSDLATIPVSVSPSENPVETGPYLPAGEASAAERDIVPEKVLPLKPEIGHLEPSKDPLWARPVYWLTNGGIGIALLTFALWQLRRKRLRTDNRLARRHAGSRHVRKALQKAQAAAKAGDPDAFHPAARFALQECICHLSNKPLEAKTLVTSDCLHILNSNNLNESVISSVQNLLGKADAFQFAGAEFDKAQLQDLSKELSSAISELVRAAK